MTRATGTHSTFAPNLRMLCAGATSIADVCRDTGINRQQFNKYLAGKAIPSARVLRKICLRLNVSEDALLGPAGAGPKSVHASNTNDPMITPTRFGKELDRLFSLFLPGHKSIAPISGTEFSAGGYYVYFPFGGVEGYLIRTYVEAWWHNDTMLFTRLTRIQGNGGQKGFVVRARHFGVAIASQGEITLLARNRHPPFQVSTINFSTAAVLQRFFVGLTMTRSAGPPIACRCVLQKIEPGTTRRQRMSICGSVPRDDPSVPAYVKAVMNSDERRGPFLQLPDPDHIIGSVLLGPH